MKHFIGLVMLLLPLVTFATPPDKSTHITNNYNYYTDTTVVETSKITVNVDKALNKYSATNNAFAALNFERSNKNLQWSCGYGFADVESTVVCGLGYRIGIKNGLLLNGATTIGAEEQQGNIGIGGTF